MISDHLLAPPTGVAVLPRTGLFDGGMGTLLQERGLEGGAPGELWNVERPEVILTAHREYAAAGADVLTTNTFGGTRPRLDLHGLGDRGRELNLAGARLARVVADEQAAAGRRVLVAGGVGPTGELLEPVGELTEDGAVAVFAEQLAALVEGGIDLVLIETLSDLTELRAAVRAAHEVAADLPVIATMSFDTNLRTMMGVRPAAAVAAAAELGLDGVGANCGRGPGEMEQIMAEMVRARTEAGLDGLRLLAQSNAGLPRLRGDRFVYDADPQQLAAHAVALRDLGVELVGACCGSTPAHIAAMGAALTRRSRATANATP
ncbi:MAG: homocysteine S-methyltransferase family protein [Kineosporiaceae bacterium]